VHGTGSQTHKGIDPESENFETTLQISMTRVMYTEAIKLEKSSCS